MPRKTTSTRSALPTQPASLPGAKTRRTRTGCLAFLLLSICGLWALPQAAGQTARSPSRTSAVAQASAAIAQAAPAAVTTTQDSADTEAKAAPIAAADQTDPTADPITVVTWNTGLDDADLQTIATQIATFSDVDLWGLQEVNSRSAPPILEAAAEEGEAGDFSAVQGTAGDGLHLVALYNADRFDLLEWYEIKAVNTTGNVRPSLVLILQEKATGMRFLFMVNHLYRSREAERHTQARLLNERAANQELPTIAVGDYNFDWDVVTNGQTHDAGYDYLTAGSRWEWVQPDILTTTQCSGWPCRYESVLDFVFLNEAAQPWSAESTIVVTPGDFPDDSTTSDHRPVQAQLWPAADPSAAATTAPQSQPAPTPTAAPSAEPLPVPSPAVAKPVVLRSANLRGGPGTTYPVTGSAQAGQSLDVDGRNADGSWLHLAAGAWIAAFLVGDAPPDLPIAEAQPPAETRSQPTAACDPAYPTLCLPPPPPDLDCAAVGVERFSVLAPDPHGFDGDGDGVGCEPAPPEPPPAPAVERQPPAVEAGANCDPSYPTVCIPPRPPDLDCGEISFRRFVVVGSDPHGFDGDGDGEGCESG